ncbi:hypothetical protein HAALTHF_05060n [Vreelandella aquamarina]|nr:hypothetical protein HAALTHF_05060n [Halomonas axialensis]
MSLMNGLPIEGGSGNNFADREYARFMHAFKTPYVSAPLVGRITNTPLVLMLVPLHDDTGRYTGFLGGLVDLKESRLFNGFDQLRLGDDGYVTITTATGQRIYAPNQQEAIVTLPDTISPDLEQALDGWEGECGAVFGWRISTGRLSTNMASELDRGRAFAASPS